MLFGYLIRLGLIFLAVYLVRDAAWISLPALGATIIVTHLGLLVLGDEVRRHLPRLSRSQARPHPLVTRGRIVFALEFPPINAILRWQDLFPTFNKIALIAVLAALIGIVIFLLAGSRDGTKAPTGHPQPGRDHRRVHRGPGRHADDGARRPALDAVPAQPVRLHLPVQPAGHHPDPADAGDGTHRHPAVPEPAGVGDLHRRRRQAPGPRLLRAHDLAARRADGAEAARRRHRGHLHAVHPARSP